MSPWTNEQMVKKLTWAHRSPGDEVHSKTELRRNQHGK